MRAETESRRTPIDPGYPSCERTTVTLRIYSGDLSPDDVAGRLQIGQEGTRTTYRGRRRTNSLGRVREEPLNAWFLSSEDIVDSRDARDHLNWLLERIEKSR